MFIYLNKNKFNYEKGQLTPVFIVVLVVFLIMALITVNLGKIGLTKTDTSNAADAGALAGGSVMANVFNGQAIANSQMVANYQMFIAEMGVLAAVTIAAMWIAVSLCASTTCPPKVTCCPSGGCETASMVAIAGTIAMAISVAAFHVIQLFTYLSMKKQAEEGKDQAIEMAYEFAFINSNIGHKLISGDPAKVDPEDKRGDDNNYSESYNKFVEGKAVLTGNYIWKDGQDRKHQVHVTATTQGVGNYKMRVTVLPTPALLALLGGALYAISGFIGYCACCPLASGGMTGLAAQATALIAGALIGLAPGMSMTGALAMLFPICWVTDIVHDRLFTVISWQEHAKQDYGLWEARYPHVESKSKVSFKGGGKIYSPKPKFDADIIEVY